MKTKSQEQEQFIAKFLEGRKQSRSGATPFQKGDIKTNNFLIEAKIKNKISKSISIQKSWIDTLNKDRFAMNKEYSALAISFGDPSENYFIVNQDLFLEIMEVIDFIEKQGE